MNEVPERAWLANFCLVDPLLWNALCRHNMDSLAALKTLEWYSLMDWPNVGPFRVLKLVNWLRSHQVELPWFSAWDEASADWRALEGRIRCPAPVEPRDF